MAPANFESQHFLKNSFDLWDVADLIKICLFWDQYALSNELRENLFQILFKLPILLMNYWEYHIFHKGRPTICFGYVYQRFVQLRKKQ